MARYALVVGVAKYDHFRNLDKAATDAEAIAHLLEQHRYNVTRLPRKLVSENQWAIDPSKKLTAAEFGTEIKTFLNDRAIRQEVVIYFAGHGFRAPDALTDEQIGYLATSDATKDGQNAIRMDALNALIKRSELGSLVMLLDCCHAGSLLEQRSLLQPTQGVISQKQNYCLIAACREFERAREGEQHGIFTAAVLQGLSAENAVQGEVTSNDLFGFISRRLQPSGQEVIHAGMGQPISLVTFAPALPRGNSPDVVTQQTIKTNEQIDNQPAYPQLTTRDANDLASEGTLETAFHDLTESNSTKAVTMNLQQRQRLEQKQKDLQTDWDLRSEKLRQLRRALAIEAGAAIQFQLKQQIQAEDEERQHLERQLNEIEQVLSRLPTTITVEISLNKELSKAEMLDLLNSLLPSQFDAVIFRYRVESANLLSNGAQNQRAIDLIQYAMQKEGESLSQLLAVVYAVAPHLKER